MLKTTAILLNEYKNYVDAAGKIKRLVSCGELIRVTKGLYETDRTVPGYCLASAIYGPSYLSFEYALAYYSLIPETVYTFTCATFEKKKKKRYQNAFGTFTYRDIPSAAYPYNIELRSENGYSIALATPEKALCDLLYTISPRNNLTDFTNLLFNDLRIDEDEFYSLNFAELKELASHYHTKNHCLLRSFTGGKHI